MLISMIFLGMATGIVGAVITGFATGSILIGLAFYVGTGLVATALGVLLELIRNTEDEVAPELRAPGMIAAE
ncbi:hypothetical protein [Ovoidimarina sediminis]|uniref:hypothetical protein n=1 Tax=Ovoidimarina sediminis TaxID=3079856 RepID=UPI00291582B8|nr:hypothetical protein [Rhodophyticola sp. MJ-SS7]MDU8945824.1 hypothetical protein [Rhodophyticola sp. MJ-SS7]